MSVYLQKIGIRESIRTRRSEWGLGAILLFAWGLTLLIDPADSLGSAPFAVLRAWAERLNWILGVDWHPETIWGVACTILGGFRVAILIINGRWRKCSHARMGFAFLSAGIWATLSLGFHRVAVGSPGVFLYLIFLIMEMNTIYEAGSDARTADERGRGPIT